MEIEQLLQDIEKKIRSEEEETYFSVHAVRYRYTIEAVQRLARGERLTILDIGCFPYHICAILKRLGHTVFGISSMHEPVEKKNVAVLNVEKEKFSYKDSSFDLVLFNEVLEHLSQSPVLALLEMRRVLKKDGLLMVTTPNITRSINRVKSLFGYSTMYPIDVFFEENGRGNEIHHRHNREYTLAELCQLLTKTSWQIVEKNRFISYTPFRKRTLAADPLWLWGVKFLNYVFMLLFPPLRDTLFVVAKK